MVGGRLCRANGGQGPPRMAQKKRNKANGRLSAPSPGEPGLPQAGFTLICEEPHKLPAGASRVSIGQRGTAFITPCSSRSPASSRCAPT